MQIDEVVSGTCNKPGAPGDIQELGLVCRLVLSQYHITGLR